MNIIGNVYMNILITLITTIRFDSKFIFVRFGFIPEDSPRSGESVSRTLDFGFADFSTAQGQSVITVYLLLLYTSIISR